MSRTVPPFERRTLRIGVFAAIFSLLLVLGLQFWWLSQLKATSIVAGRAALNGLLDAVTTEVLYSYGPIAERALDVPSSYFAGDRLKKAANHFRNREVEVAKRLFVIRFTDADRDAVLFYDSETNSMTLAEPSRVQKLQGGP